MLVAAIPGRAPEPARENGEEPCVGVLLSAYNEEKHIRGRLENLQESCYGPDRVRIYVGVDGATDGTAGIVAEWAAGRPNVVLQVQRERRGKTATLKSLAARSTEPLLVFTDANTFFEPATLRKLVSHFRDPRVGGVCGRLVFHEAPSGETEETAYWGWEDRLKMHESRLDSCLGANGAVYAIRRELFPAEIPANTIVDDFVIGMKVREQGCRMVYDPSAVAHEQLPRTVRDEWQRRVRIGAGDYQALWLCRRCLLPRFGAFAFAFWSHKVLRWFTPHLLVAMAVLSGAGIACEYALAGPLSLFSHAGVLSLSLAAQIVFYACAAVGRHLGNGPGGVRRSLRGCHYFVAMQAALLAGFFRFVSGPISGTWARTPR